MTRVWPPDDMPMPVGGYLADCKLCDHPWGDHSHILLGQPCLTCSCIGFTERRLSNPTIISMWSCPICGESTENYGTERRRIGRRPWKRLVHIDCHKGDR